MKMKNLGHHVDIVTKSERDDMHLEERTQRLEEVLRVRTNLRDVLAVIEIESKEALVLNFINLFERQERTSNLARAVIVKERARRIDERLIKINEKNQLSRRE